MHDDAVLCANKGYDGIDVPQCKVAESLKLRVTIGMCLFVRSLRIPLTDWCHRGRTPVSEQDGIYTFI